MRRIKSLLFGVAALALAGGTAYAGGDMSHQSSAENRSESALVMELEQADRLAGAIQPEAELLAESDVIYIYPIEVTEYYLVVPSESSEMPG